jgi:hypothetical protein
MRISGMPTIKKQRTTVFFDQASTRGRKQTPIGDCRLAIRKCQPAIAFCQRSIAFCQAPTESGGVAILNLLWPVSTIYPLSLNFILS